jgi:uncharacterized membrane protein
MSELSINAQVECVDGPCGRAITTIVDRATRRVTHLVVEDETLPYKPYQRLVPIDQLAEATRDRVRLRCKREDVARMEPFVQSHYVIKTGLSYSVYQGGEGPPPDESTAGASYTKVDEEKVPAGAVAIKPGTAVAATDGDAGVVSDLVIDLESGEVTHLGVQTDGPQGKVELSLPLAAIERVAGGTVYLKLSRQAIAQLPAIPVKYYTVKGAQEPAKIDLVAVAFDGPEDAGEAMKLLERGQKQGQLKILNAAVLAKDAAGKVAIKDARDLGPKKGRRLGALTGGLIGLAGGPIGAVVGALAGAGAGGLAGAKIDSGFSDEFLRVLEKHLKPGTSGLLLLVEHEEVQRVADAIGQEKRVLFQQTLTDRLVEELLATGEGNEPGH